jgi:CYTH domain-containing protein/CHAD domain-containing protein
VGCEIERKFLLDRVPRWLEDDPAEPLDQGYLTNGSGEAEVRLRRAGERLLMTVKAGSGEVREELEVPIEAELFERLWPLTEERRLTKTRHRARLAEGLEAEVDVYEGDLAGLLVAEVEFASSEESARFQPPSWFGAEVTGDPRYANRYLAEAGPPPAASAGAHPKAFHLKRREEVGAGLRRIAAGRAAKIVERLDGVSDAGLAAAVHGARKDIKKARAVLRLGRDQLGEDLFAAENSRYRDAGRLLSGSRDAEVKLQTLAGLEERFGHELPSASAGGWKRLLERERDAVADSEDGEARERIGEVVAAIAEARGRIAAWPLEGDSWELLAPGLKQSYRKGRAAMSDVGADPDPELVHEWRKRSKDLWYQARLVERAWPSLLGATVGQLHELADLLGDHHDLSVLADDLAGREEVGSRPALAALIEQRQDELLPEALALGSRIYAEKPKAFVRRLGAYWAAWR